MDLAFNVDYDQNESEIISNALKAGNSLGLKGQKITSIDGPFISDLGNKVYTVVTQNLKQEPVEEKKWPYCFSY